MAILINRWNLFNGRFKFLQLVAVALLSFIAAKALMAGIDITMAVSRYPIASLIIKMLLCILLLVPIIIGKKEYYYFFFLFSFPFMRIMFVGITLISAYAFILTLVYWREIYSFMRSSHNMFKFSLGFFLLSIVVSTIMARYPADSLGDLVFFISLGLIYFVSCIFMNSVTNQKLVIKILCVIFIFCCLTSFFQFVFGINSVRFFFGEYNSNVNVSGFLKRIPSVFWEAQGAGQYFAIFVMLLLGLKSNFNNLRWLRLILIVMGMVCLCLTKSRLSILAFISLFILIQLFTASFRKIAVLVFFTLLLILLGSVAIKIVPSTLKARFNSVEMKNSKEYRVKLWQSSLPIIISNPLGVGLGSANLFDAASKNNVFSLKDFKDFRQRRRGIQFENSYLHLLYSLGVLGLLSFILCVAKFFSLGSVLLKNKSDMFDQRYILHLLATMAIWLTCVFTSPQILEAQSMIIFIVLLALMTSCWILSTDSKNDCIYKLR